jgi:hypothetical protein
MKLTALTLFVVGCIVTAATASPPETPAIPYYDWGACPFECCTYQEWESEKAVTAYSQRSETSPAAFSVVKGEKILAVTGVVITTRYGVVKLRSAGKYGYLKTSTPPEPQLSLQAGEVIYTLHYEGEGSYLFWYKGKTYSDGIGDSGDDEHFDVVSKPDYVWWAKLKNAGGKIGWTKDIDAFAHVDRCE